VPKASSNKGQKRQDDWLDCLNQLLKTGNLKKHIRLVVEKLVKLPNVPQKKAKFENFLKNVGIKSPAIIAEAWGVISKVLEEMKAKKKRSFQISRRRFSCKREKRRKQRKL